MPVVFRRHLARRIVGLAQAHRVELDELAVAPHRRRERGQAKLEANALELRREILRRGRHGITRRGRSALGRRRGELGLVLLAPDGNDQQHPERSRHAAHHMLGRR